MLADAFEIVDGVLPCVMTQRRLTARKRTGATTVEFAITVPILFSLLFTAFEFSRMNVIRQTAVNAAYEGARRGIVPGASETDVEDVAPAAY